MRSGAGILQTQAQVVMPESLLDYLPAGQDLNLHFITSCFSGTWERETESDIEE